MARTTRRGTQWSPWEFDVRLNLPEIFQSRVSLAPYLEQAIEAAQLRDAASEAHDEALEDEDAWEDDVPVTSRPITPLSRPLSPLTPLPSRSPSPPSPSELCFSSLPARSPSPLSDPPPSPPPPIGLPFGSLPARSPSPLSDPPPSPPPKISARKRHQKAGKKTRRSRARVSRAQATAFGPLPQARHSQSYREDASHIASASAADLSSSSGGNWIGSRPVKKSRLSRARLRRLKDLLKEDYNLVRWDGRRPKLILDADGRIVAVLLGRPEGADWDRVLKEVQRLMDAVRRRGVRQGIFTSQNKEHRRGNFFTMRAGLTRGPGQKRPGNLTHSKTYRRLLQRLLANHSVGRIVGFQSSGLGRYLPKLYQHQRSTMQGILHDQPELRMPFDNSIFPTVTFNLGPDVVTAEHLDLLNNAYGMCGITSNGSFDHTRGGHIYIKQLKTVCEFPSGSTILLLSATCEHGNTPIRKGETRYSMTQYAAGGLFRWAAYGYQSTSSLLAEAGGEARKQEIDGAPGEHATFALGLLSKADELDADREEVFGKMMH
ncbi:hypothetical protein K438DRAFT_1680740 [Mycena galopus ATCC 62051]|nr:hypothetical protein K438DRAFT_1680740 [Mycena galopus ATCC 62051]